jgi:hypothetical protein
VLEFGFQQDSIIYIYVQLTICILSSELGKIQLEADLPERTIA